MTSILPPQFMPDPLEGHVIIGRLADRGDVDPECPCQFPASLGGCDDHGHTFTVVDDYDVDPECEPHSHLHSGEAPSRPYGTPL